MDWALVFVLQVMFQPSLSVLFTVVAEQIQYKSEFEGAVVMGCRFQPVPSDIHTGLQVSWHWTTANSIREVYVMDNGKEDLSSQHPDFQGRVKLVTEELQKGRAEIQVSSLKINDSGTYQCLVKTGEGADYKKITLSVTAPYKAVTKHIQEAAERGEVLLTCKSEGYPSSPVVWEDGLQQTLTPNTTSVSTPEQLFKITSQIQVKSSDKNNYTCTFINGDHSATFHIPDEIPLHHVKNHALIAALFIGVILIVIIVAVLICRRRKGFGTTGTRNILVNVRTWSVSGAAWRASL